MAIAIGVIGLAMSAYSIYQSVSAAKEAEEIGRDNQKRIEAEAEEEARRERYTLARQQSLIKARVAASGIKGVTPEAYFTEFSRQRENEIRWIQTSAESRGKIARRQGSRAATVGYAQAAQTGSQTAFSSYAWFKTYAK